MSNITLYSYFRSSCSWRVRIALNLLNIEHEIKHVNLLKNEQNSEWYRRINPLGTVPALTSPSLESPIWQSLAIIDFLDKEQSLLPQDPIERARCLEIALTIVAEIQPLQNLSVMNRVAQLGGQEEKMKWALEHNRSKLGILEKMISGKSNFSVSNNISLADICIVPQLYSAQRFGINLSKEFPGLLGIAKKLERIDAFERAHAHSQADCPNDLRESPKHMNMRGFLNIVVATLLAGCSSQKDVSPYTELPNKYSKGIQTDLYFGGSYRDPSVWPRFLRESVTPRFAGFTVLMGQGNWKDRVGLPTMILRIIHSEEELSKIEEIRKIFLEQFHHQSVMLVSMPVYYDF